MIYVYQDVAYTSNDECAPVLSVWYQSFKFKRKGFSFLFFLLE